MKVSKASLKRVAVLILIAFGLSQGLEAAPAAGLSSKPVVTVLLQELIKDPSQLQIPADAAKLHAFHAGSNGKLLIHFQDPHSNAGGQFNLARTLESLIETYGLSLILVEAASGDVTLSNVREQSTLKTWKRAAKRFVYEGKLSGEEYVNLTTRHPIKLAGIEDPALYTEGLARYAALADKRHEVLGYLRQTELVVERLKNRMYPRPLIDLERSIDFDTVPLSSAEELISYAVREGISLEPYGSIKKWIGIVNPELKTNSDALRKDLGEVDLSLWFSEMSRLERSLYRTVLTDPEALKLRAIDAYTGLLKHALRIQTSSRDFESLKLNAPFFEEASVLAFLNRLLMDYEIRDTFLPMHPELKKARSAAEAFYANVAQRDAAFVRNTQKLMANENAAVLIAGGFHTENLMETFKKLGYSIAICSPLVSAETDAARYEKILLSVPTRKPPSRIHWNKDAAKLRVMSLLEEARLFGPQGSRLNEILELAGVIDGRRTPADAAIKKTRYPKIQVTGPGMDQTPRSGFSVSESRKDPSPDEALLPQGLVFHKITEALHEIPHDELSALAQYFAGSRLANHDYPIELGQEAVYVYGSADAFRFFGADHRMSRTIHLPHEDRPRFHHADIIGSGLPERTSSEYPHLVLPGSAEAFLVQTRLTIQETRRSQ